MNVTFNGGGTFIFPNAFADLPKTRRVWAKRGVCAYLYNVCVMVQNRDISKQEIQEMLVRRTWLFFPPPPPEPRLYQRVRRINMHWC